MVQSTKTRLRTQDSVTSPSGVLFPQGNCLQKDYIELK